jgi:hypothetical protein
MPCLATRMQLDLHLLAGWVEGWKLLPLTFPNSPLSLREVVPCGLELLDLCC